MSNKKATATAKKPVAKTSDEWNSLEETLQSFKKKFKEDGHILNNHVLPLEERFNTGERTDDLKFKIENLARL